jgi:undecaprenyl-diphosphatase
LNGLQALFLGVVQGLTEFLPVSSSGHLVIFETLLGVKQKGVLFEVAVHVATLASVLIVYRRRVGWLIAGVLMRRPEAWRYAGKLVLATVPAVLAVLAVGDFFEEQFQSPRVVGFCLLATGCILWTTRHTLSRATAPEPSWSAALWIGCAQVVAILPGISRSGTTVAAALALGVAPLAAAEFSFLMSVMAITGAAVEKLPELEGVSASQAASFAIGGAAALVCGVAAILLFVRLLRSRAFYRFAFYTWAAGAAFLVWLAIG